MIPLSLRPFAKSVLPATLTVLAVAGQWVATGELGRAELATALTGFVGAAVTFAVSNGAEVHMEESDDSPDAAP